MYYNTHLKHSVSDEEKKKFCKQSGCMTMGKSCSFTIGGFVGMIIGILTFIGFLFAAFSFVRWFITGKICCCRVSKPISGEDEVSEPVSGAVEVDPEVEAAKLRAAEEARAARVLHEQAEKDAQAVVDMQFEGGLPLDFQFRPCSLGDVKFLGENCLEFAQQEKQWRTCFIDPPVKEGVIRWTVRRDCDHAIAVGVACTDVQDSFTSASCLGSVPKSWGFYFDDGNNVGGGRISSGKVWGVMESDTACSVRYNEKYNNNKELSVEVDCNALVISFFLNRNKLPVAVTGISLPVNIGVSIRLLNTYYSRIYNGGYESLQTPTPSTEYVTLLKSRW